MKKNAPVEWGKVWDSTYHRHGCVARLRGEREDGRRGNRTTRGRGHNQTGCANVDLSNTNMA